MTASKEGLFTRRTIWIWFVVGLTALLVGIFVKLTFETVFEGVNGDPELTIVDRSILLFFASYRNPGLTAVTIDLTALGSTTVLTILSIALFLLSWMKRDRTGALHVAVGSIGAGLLTLLLKGLFERDRPNVISRLAEVQGFSYPSGHSLAAAAIYFTLAVVACRYFKSFGERVVLFCMSGTIVVLISLSRIYLGVHYPSDVVAGIALGSAWAFLIAAGIMALRPKETSNH